MSEALMQMYESLNEEEQQEVYDFVLHLVEKKDERTESQKHLDEFFGIIDDETAEVMLQAVAECRRIEPNEW